jgi:hypothetical protein
MGPRSPFVGGGTGPSPLFVHGGTGPSLPFVDGGVGPRSPFVRGGAGSSFAVRGTGRSSPLIGGGAGRSSLVFPSSFVDGVAGRSLHYSWVVVVGPSRAVRGWYWCPASVFVCHGAGGSSSWSWLSFEGEGGGSLFVFAGARRSSVPVGGRRRLCPVRGGGW